ncbi:hypothetical protein FRAAL5268 [Frankia alni ACN14a]|uniref:Uncharacterized protein n=1 Tax=Frankia alni (strain DSM 45986 / CECT 9034 / ACN14a) TaxID=326424 RepID=Q0RF50_FRAAA|nr:hypothetical protein FRAAL5268 [Frankia alni ACN14a]
MSARVSTPLDNAGARSPRMHQNLGSLRTSTDPEIERAKEARHGTERRMWLFLSQLLPRSRGYRRTGSADN